MIKSPLRYPGGKSKAIDKIKYLVPEFKEFREPFVGGGSLFIYLQQKYPECKYWINDLYFELYNFWDMSQKHLKEVISQVILWKEQFTYGKELYKFLNDNTEQFNRIQKAAAFFVFNRITFSGTTDSGGYSELSYRGRFTNSSIERLSLMDKVLEKVKITNYDYQKVIEEEGDDVFIFLDPPYYSASKSALYGKNGNLHKSFDHERFAYVMKNCKHKWLLTYDDSQYVKDLFPFANIVNFELMYGMRNQTPTSSQKGNELFISNFELLLPKQQQMSLALEKKGKYSRKKL